MTSSLLSYDETTAHTITQELCDAGHYVHRYTSYNKYRFQDSFDLDPLITVATNNRFKTMRRLRSFDPVKSLISLSDFQRTSQQLKISKLKSKKPTTTTFSVSEDGVRKSLKEYHRQENDKRKSISKSSVNFSYVE